MDKYLKAVKQNVCSICADSNEKGGCTLNSQEICAVELFLPKIVTAVQSTDTEDLKLMQNLLRETVCAKCREEAGDGCILREDANCSLDRYFPLIVDTIRKVDKEMMM